MENLNERIDAGIRAIDKCNSHGVYIEDLRRVLEAMKTPDKSHTTSSYSTITFDTYQETKVKKEAGFYTVDLEKFAQDLYRVCIYPAHIPWDMVGITEKTLWRIRAHTLIDDGYLKGYQ